MGQLSNDLIFGVRIQFKTPASAAAIVLTLALGIAATSVSFSLANGFFLRPPAVERPDRLVRISPRFGAEFGIQMSYPDITDVSDMLDVFAGAPGEEPVPIIAILQVSIVVAWVPTHRAIRVSAATALRYE